MSPTFPSPSRDVDAPTLGGPPGGGDHERPSSPTPDTATTPQAPPPAPTSAQSGGSVDTIGSIPSLTLPTGLAMVVRDGPVQFRWILDRFEGNDTFRSPTEIGELQATTTKNLLTDQQTMRKRGGSADVSTSGAVALVGLHEVSGLRDLMIDALDATTGWVESDAANFSRTLETTKKVEGTGSLKLTVVTGSGADNDTVKKDLGVGATIDLSVFDGVELMLRGSNNGVRGLKFGVSEDDVTYQEVTYAGTTTDTWETIFLDLTGVAANSRNGIRYLKFTSLNNVDATSWYVDSIRAVQRVQYRLRGTRTAGTSTGGVRDTVATTTVNLDTDVSGAWVLRGTIHTVRGNDKLRAVDWLGTTYVLLGSGGAFKLTTTTAPYLQIWEEAPPSRFITVHYEKLWLFSQMFDPHGLRHSDTSSATSFPTTSLPVGGNGGLFYVGRRTAYLPTGMKSALGQLFLFTEGDCWILFGTDNNSFALQRAHPGAGTLSNESVAVTSDTLLWHDGIGDRIIMWKGGGVVDVGVPIRPTLQAIPAARKPWTAGVSDGRYYYFSYTRNGQTVNDRTYVFDTQLFRWFGPYEGDWVGFTSGYLGVDGLIYVGTETNGVRKLPSGTSDTGSAIAVGWKSAAFNFRLPRWTKRMRRLWVKCENTTATLTVNLYKDLAASPVRSYPLTFTGGATETQSTGIDPDVLGDVMQVEITESSTNALTINEIGLDGYMLRALR